MPWRCLQAGWQAVVQRDCGREHGSSDFTIRSVGYLTGFHSTLNDDLQR